MKVRLQPIPHVAREFDARPIDLFVDYEGNTSTLQVPSPGVSLLLGKNGTGKSSLLRALTDFTKGIEHGQSTKAWREAFPRVSLGFQLPTEDEFLEYLLFVDEFKQSPRYKEIMSSERENTVILDENFVDERLFALPLVSALNDALEDDFRSFEFEIRDRRLGAVETLREFLLPMHEVQAFEQRQAAIRSRRANSQHYRWEAPGDYRERFCEFLLHQLRHSTVHCADEADPWWGYFENSSDLWIDDKDHRALFLAAIRDVFTAGVLRLTRWRYDLPPDLCFCVQADTSENIRRYAEACKNSSRDKDNSVTIFDPDTEESFVGAVGQSAEELGFDTRPAFPLDILETRNSGYWYSASFFPTSEDSEWTSQVERFITCFEIPAAVTSDRIVAAVTSVLRWMPTFNLDEGLGNSGPVGIQLELEGLEELRELLKRASSVLSQLDIGITELSATIQHARSYGKPRGSTRSDAPDTPISVRLSFSGRPDGAPRPLEQASDGQLSAIFAVLSVLGNHFAYDHSFRRSAVNIAVADEFDRHLHPSTADKLLSVLHQKASDAELSLLVSTHSVPLLDSPNLRSCRRIYAERDFFDRIEIGVKPSHSLTSFAGLLGTSALQARSLKRLHVVVEGNTDEFVLREVLDDPRLPVNELDFLVMDGMRQLKSLWRSSISYLSSPILVVYDNRSMEFEDEWHGRVHGEPAPWSEQPVLRQLEHQLKTRRQNQRAWGSAGRETRDLIERAVKENSRMWDNVLARHVGAFEAFLSHVLASSSNPTQRDRFAGLVRARTDLRRSGDEELAALLSLAKEVLDPSRHDDFQVQARRIHFFGLDQIDIVDYLPIEYFVATGRGQKGVPAKSRNWADARERVASKSGDDFKHACGITGARVKQVLQQMRQDDRMLHGDRLNELRATASGLLEARW